MSKIVKGEIEMAETIRSYIDKNLTHLNWNILPQIFESEGVELTEEIERYLRETPKNTNWNVLKELSNHTPIDLGTLFYQGSLQEGNINEDEGAMVQDPEEWHYAIESSNMYMVIENNIVLGTKVDENCVSFVFNNNTVSITITTDGGTGDSVVVISGDVPSHYEIYAKQVE